MRRAFYILVAVGALSLLAWGVERTFRPTPPPPLSRAQIDEQIEALAVRLNAAIENERDVTPLYDELRPLLNQRPDTAAGQRLLGQLRTRMDDVPGALAAYERALQLEPGDPQLENLAGTAAMILGDRGKAERHHRTAVKLAPDVARLHLALGDVLLKTGQWDEAIVQLSRALELDTTLHEAASALSDTYRGRGNGSGGVASGGGPGDALQSLEWMERAIAKLPLEDETRETRVVYARKLAALYAERGDPAEASRVLGSLSPDMLYSPDVSRDLAGYYVARGQPLLAALHYEIVLQERPGNADAAATAARYYLEGGDIPAARTLIRRLSEIDPGHEALEGLRGSVQ